MLSVFLFSLPLLHSSIIRSNWGPFSCGMRQTCIGSLSYLEKHIWRFPIQTTISHLRPWQEEVFLSHTRRVSIKSASAVWRNTSAVQRASGSEDKAYFPRPHLSHHPNLRKLSPHLLQTCWNPCLHSCLLSQSFSILQTISYTPTTRE